MRKIIFTLLALAACSTVDAQIIEVYNGNNNLPIATYDSNYKVKFRAKKAIKTTEFDCKTYAKRNTINSDGTIGTVNGTDQEFVQLWEDGPKFAKTNVNSGTENNKFQIPSGSNATADPLTYYWGSNWRLPTMGEMVSIMSNCNVTCIDNTSASDQRFKYTLKITNKNDESLFITLDVDNTPNSSAPFWKGEYWTTSLSSVDIKSYDTWTLTRRFVMGFQQYASGEVTDVDFYLTSFITGLSCYVLGVLNE